ncbi:MAG: acetyl-CoA carboxylase biotin carboxyl carrier protein subunit [Oscillospiraceae bacterium]|nr:acetyl-CoA carboxylase biotin carboxyl carrier protein subunit [Oscillospiraceae bacterium]
MKRYCITVNGMAYDVTVEETDAVEEASVQEAPAPKPRAANPGKQGGIKIEAPMPGTIIDIKLGAGAVVQKGSVIAVLEAMKMENDIVAATDGVIVSVNVKKGDSVGTGAVIATMSASV